MDYWNDIYKLYGIVLDLRELLGKIINGRLREYDRLETKPSLNEIKQGDKVEVFWADATTCPHGVHSLDEACAHEPSTGKTIGYLLKDDNEFVTLSMTHFFATGLPPTECPEDGFKYLWLIPKGVITSIKKQGDIE